MRGGSTCTGAVDHGSTMRGQEAAAKDGEWRPAGITGSAEMCVCTDGDAVAANGPAIALLASDSALEATMSEATEEQWHVQIEEGDVRLWTLDQLDAAFKAELVDESTFVLEVGKTEWMQLGTLLGGDGDDEAPSEAAPAVASVASVQAPALAPVMFVEPPNTMSPYSTAPMASDIDDLDSPAAFRSGSSRKRPIAIGIGVALLAAGVAVFASRGGVGSTESAAAQVAAAPAPPPVAPSPPAVADAPTPAQDTSLAARLTQDQRQKLADADKAHEAKVAAQQKTRAAAAVPRHGHKVKEKGPFQTGGDKYDPLNAKL
jgi:hypothetical protein